MATRRVQTFITGLVCGTAYAVLFGVACRWPEGWAAMLTWLAPAPLIACGLRRPVGWLTLAGVYVGAIGFWAYWHQWVWTNNVSPLGFVLMSLYLGAWAPAYVGAVALIRRRLGLAWAIVALPIAWTALEYLRGEVLFYGYPWYLIAHPAIESDVARHLASLVGVYMVGFVHIAAWAAFVGLFVAMRRRWPGGGFGALAGVALSGCAFALIPLVSMLVSSGGTQVTGARQVRIAAVQTNVPQDNRAMWTPDQRIADFARFAQLTHRAASADPPPDLIVWPETMYPGYFGLTDSARAAIREAGLALPLESGGRVSLSEFPVAMLALQREVGVPVLVGAVAIESLELELRDDGTVREEAGAHHNSAFLLTDGAVTDQRYDKLRLTPFGEVLPYAEWWPWLEDKVMAVGARGMSFGLSRGDGPRTITVPIDEGESLTVATPICFEATMPRLCRRLARPEDGRSVDVLLNMTNDGWFGAFDPGRRMHMILARWRCAELGVPMVRVANTGMSASIGPDGALYALGPNLGEPAPPSLSDGVLIADLLVPIAGSEATTLYARLGEWPASACVVLFFALLVGAGAGAHRARKASAPPVEEAGEPASR